MAYDSREVEIGRVEIGEALDLSDDGLAGAQPLERIPLEDPGTVDFGTLADPDLAAYDPTALIGVAARPLAGVAIGGLGDGLERAASTVLPPVPAAAVEGNPAGSDGPPAPFGPSASLVFDLNGERMDSDPAFDPAADGFGAEPMTAQIVDHLPVREQLPDPETVEIGDEIADMASAARALLADDAAPGDTPVAPSTELERLQRALEEYLLRAMARRLNEPDWYLTGVEVGLESLRRLYECSRMVYANYRHRSAGVAKIENLRVVYEQLLAFRTADGALERGRILIGYRKQFEELLGDMQEGRRRSRGLSSASLTLYEQVAKDVTEGVNRQRTYQNLIRAIDGIAKLPKMMQRTRDKRIATLVAGYEQILRTFGWSDAESFQTKGQLIHKERQLRDQVRRSRRHLQQIRDELYKDMPFAIDNPDTPELDLDVRKVIPFLRKTSKDGLDYLSRAFSVYEHALEISPRARQILARIEELELGAAGAPDPCEVIVDDLAGEEGFEIAGSSVA